jgi:UDP-glucose 4-epimerase
LGAAALAGVRKLILPSSTVVYGASPEHPAFLDEDNAFAGRPSYAYVRELREIENFVNGFRRQQSEMVITSLRFANILGGGMASPLAQLLSLPAAPVLLGFDPMFQVIHPDDVLAAVLHCLANDCAGVYNIAARPAMPLLKIMALAATPPLPILHPLAYLGFRSARLLSPTIYGLAPFPWDYLRYSWVAASERMSAEMGFEPSIDAETTVRQFGEAVRRQRYQDNAAYRFVADRLQNAATAVQAG